MGDASGAISGMVKVPDILTHAVLWLILSAIAASCASSVEAPEIDKGPDGSTMSFRFTIYTDENRVTSRGLGEWEENAATIAERILNVDDMRILFFDQSGVLLKSVRPSSLDYNAGYTANDGYYSLSVAFTHDYFDKFDRDANVSFTVMILANLESVGGRFAGYTPGYTRVSDIADSFMMTTDFFPTESGGIPMYGIKGFSVIKEQLMQGLDAPFTGQIDLIRSLCKIEVADKIVNSIIYPDGNKYPQVKEVEMISWVDRGYIRPKFDDYSEGLKFANIYPASVATDIVVARKINDKYIIYCPEAKIKDMKFRVKAVLSPGAAPRQFETGLDPFASEIGDELVRNHIYRFDIHAFNTILDLNVNVSDWIALTDEFELDDVVSMEPDGFLKWEYDNRNFAVTTELYNGKKEEQLSILNATTSCASGTFHIMSPRGAIWKAYFIPGENGVDAFEFVDVDDEGNIIEGSQSVFAEGYVGEPATIHIRGKGPADAYRHWTELVVEVRTIDGIVLYAPLTSAMSSRFIIYRENRL